MQRQSYKFIAVSALFACYCLYQAGLLNSSQLQARCDCSGHNFCFQPSSVRFNCSSLGVLRDLGLLAEEGSEWPTSLDWSRGEPQFVTAASSNHAGELASSVAVFQKAFPGTSLLLYDLGLSTLELEKASKWCDVTIRRYNASKYGDPSLLGNLGQYRWKSLIAAEVLRSANAVWYLDSSVRWSLKASQMLPSLYEAVANESLAPILLPSRTFHSILFATHGGIYSYLPIGAAEVRETEMHQAGWMLAVHTAAAQEALKWQVLCALEPDCMAPSMATMSCDLVNVKDRWSSHGGQYCHRFDQSAFNIILTTLFGAVNSSRPYYPATHELGLGEVARSADQEQPRSC